LVGLSIADLGQTVNSANRLIELYFRLAFECCRWIGRYIHWNQRLRRHSSG
jgi:hypothetical protein